MILDINKVRKHLLGPDSAETRQKFEELGERFKGLDQKEINLIFFQTLGQLADSGVLHQGEYSMYRKAFEAGDEPGPTFLASLFALVEVASKS